MPQVALSYRRDDSAGITGRIYEKLAGAFGSANTFIDVDGIPFGVDFRDHIRGVLGRVDCLLVIIGPRWLGASGEKRRIDDPTDPVRVEVATAIKQGLKILPVLVDGAKMPVAANLPAEIAAISYLNAIEVESGRDFRMHSARLVETLRHIDRTQEPILLLTIVSAAAAASVGSFLILQAI